jgi:hypothetical protein
MTGKFSSKLCIFMTGTLDVLVINMHNLLLDVPIMNIHNVLLDVPILNIHNDPAALCVYLGRKHLAANYAYS